jgi:hypothetical protein
MPVKGSTMLKRVILESPFAPGTRPVLGVDTFFSEEANVAYARECLRDSLLRGEAPLASHLLYTQPGVLDDTIPHERERGIDAGLAWGHEAEATVVYLDHGVSHGMILGVERAVREGRPVELRVLRRALSFVDHTRLLHLTHQSAPVQDLLARLQPTTPQVA